LEFRQIAATAVVVPGEAGTHQVKETLYGLGVDGRVYILTDRGWSAMPMHRAGPPE